jgi:hypothetical protein
MALINKNWKLLSEDYVEEGKQSKKINKNNLLKPNQLTNSSDYLDFSNNLDDEISPILPPLSKSLNINMVNAFATVENEYLEKKTPKKITNLELNTNGNNNSNNNNNTNNKHINSQYIKYMDNIGNPFLNPKMNGIEISENEAYKGKATICSPSIEVKSVIGSILEADDDDDDENEYNDNDEEFEKNMENININTEFKKDINNNGEENKENIDYNIMSSLFLRSNKNNDIKNSKASNVVSNVTSFRKYSLPTSTLNRMADDGKYLQRSKSGNRKIGSITPLSLISSNNNSNSNNNNNTKTTNNTTTNNNNLNNKSNNKSYYHKNKDYERILAAHDYKARDNREMNLDKGDVLIVKQRQGSWIYCVKEYNIFKVDPITNQPIKYEHRDHGWIPSTYVKPYNIINNKLSIN